MVTIEALQPCELFAGLDEKELEQIAAIAREETYQAGDLICAERQIADRLFILQSGRVQVHIRLRTSHELEGEATIEEMEPGQEVRAGWCVGLTGRTGNMGFDLRTPDHLHFGVKVRGNWMDPNHWLRDNSDD